jgi:hypothetical protein
MTGLYRLLAVLRPELIFAFLGTRCTQACTGSASMLPPVLSVQPPPRNVPNPVKPARTLQASLPRRFCPEKMRGSGVKDCPAPIVSQSKSLRARDPLERAISLGIAELVGAPHAVLLIVLAAMTRIRAVSVYGSAWLSGRCQSSCYSAICRNICP